MLKRQREGVAKAEGKYVGRQPTRRKSDQVLRLRAEGKSANDIVTALGISRASVFRKSWPRPVHLVLTKFWALFPKQESVCQKSQTQTVILAVNEIVAEYEIGRRRRAGS